MNSLGQIRRNEMPCLRLLVMVMIQSTFDVNAVYMEVFSNLVVFYL